MTIERGINYVELPATDLQASKDFFGALLGWQFVDYGEDYCSFNDGRINGGFYRAERAMSRAAGSALIVFYADDLEAAQQRVIELDGRVVEEIFSFPGGRRFHFAEPGGSEYAIWSDK